MYYFVFMYVYIYLYIYISIYTFIYICLYIYVCVYICFTCLYHCVLVFCVVVLLHESDDLIALVNELIIGFHVITSSSGLTNQQSRCVISRSVRLMSWWVVVCFGPVVFARAHEE